MDIQEYLKSKKKSQDWLTDFHQYLYEIHTGAKVDENISKYTASLVLMFLNAYPNYREGNTDYWSYRDGVSVNSKRMSAFAGFGDLTDFWNEKNYPALVLMFGEELAPYVKKAWDKIPSLPYQQGYSRRSFRSSQLSAVYFTRQLNMIINLYVGLDYELSMEEYVLYDHAMYYRSDFSLIWAVALEEKDEKLFQLMSDIVYNRHPTAKVSRRIIKAFLLSEREDAWKAIEDLLLSAQRQEGLRQSILEQLDETSIGAMIHFIKVILEHNLSRFSSVVRALDTWAGLGWEAEKESTIKRHLQLGLRFLEQPEEAGKAVTESKDNVEIYMALWALGVRDVKDCLPFMEKLMLEGTLEKRCLVLYFTYQMELPGPSKWMIIKGLEAEDKTMKSLHWIKSLIHSGSGIGITVSSVLSRENKVFILQKLEEKLALIPKNGKTFSGSPFSWLSIELTQDAIYNTIFSLVSTKYREDTDLLLRHFSDMSVHHRERVTLMLLPDFYYASKAEKLPKDYRLGKFERDFALSILKDKSFSVKEAAINALKFADMDEEEFVVFEDLLKSKSSEIRKSIISFILKKEMPLLKTSTGRLLKAGNQEQRLAGLDILNQLQKREEYQEWTQQKAREFKESRKVTVKEQILIDNLMQEESILHKYTAENGYGLFNPAFKRSLQSPTVPTSGEYVDRTKQQAFGLSKSPEYVNRELQKLFALLDQHQDYEYTVEHWDNEQETVLLGNRFTGFKLDESEMTPEEKFYNYPLADVWKKWMDDSGLEPVDLFIVNYAIEIALIYNKIKLDFPLFNGLIDRLVFRIEIAKDERRLWNYVNKIFQNLRNIYPYKEEEAFLEGLMQTVLANIPQEEMYLVKSSENRWSQQNYTWRDVDSFEHLYNEYQSPEEMNEQSFINFWHLEYWRNNSLPEGYKVESYQSSIHSFCRAYALGLITYDELMHRILQPRAINELSTPFKKRRSNKEDLNKQFPFLKEIMEKCSTRLLEVELVRGDSATSVTLMAQNLKRIWGMDYFVKLLLGLGKDTLHRGYVYGGNYTAYDKKMVFSSLLRVCYPLESESQEDFTQKIKAAKLTDKRLIEAALYAPQWLPFVGNYLGWNGLDSAVWWLHAHTNDRHDAETETEIARYSKVDIAAFKDGAVDTNWFSATFKELGKEKWKMVYDAAKYITDGTGHKRAQLYSDVILGNTKIREVTKRVKDKRNQDYLRVFGLVPLSKKTPDKDLLQRYQYLQQFKKESKQFGSQRQASEGLAVKVAMENLARTAGYDDPMRLTWVMETAEAQQIMQQAETLTFDKVEISLKVNGQGKPEIHTFKDGKPLKSIPAKLRNDKAVKELRDYQKVLKNQYSRTFKSLEEAMVNGDAFTNSEINSLMTHPVVRPMLEKLVLKSGEALGFWQEGVLVDSGGSRQSLNEHVHIAHCTDLYASGKWSDFQRYCFEKELKQPFKQVFRELYLPTEDELAAKSVSKRYDGHQVQPKKTVALLKGRGWTVDYEEGLQKVFHKEGYIAKMYAMADWFSPADVESPTLETVQFINRKTWKNVPFEEVDARIFSEIMRDVDLVVSVAHVGDVDPEASHSTVEMRGVLVRETARMFKLKNVEVKGNHVHIEGTTGEYSVHLGSAVVHQKPGRYISILPVHSQHRGRLFLPFVDDDPKSAELMSKVLLLAKDQEIQDPTILSQLKMH
ncbi:DUF4132 domain-containing protein [Rapidithrix thailandica]|uniref:DUF4132 domain-containing protein n=1 Tax=Rapidithrix thailandica TaxID=413964 RepID=A0AAW9S344_9BACT